MLGIRFIKVDPSTYLIQYRNGQVVREGAGLSLFYYEPSTSLVSIPIASEDLPFMFNELTGDFQEVTVQGQVTCKVVDVHALSKMLNYTLDGRGEYVSDDPKKLSKRVINLVQVAIRKELSALSLKQAMPASEQIASTIRQQLADSEILRSLGVAVMELSLVAIRPNQETARALEAETREILMRQADEAIYIRRNAAIEQERIIKENELNTEVAVELKKREIMARKLESEREEQARRQEIQEAKLAGEVVLQQRNGVLATLMAENSKKAADAKAYAIEAELKAIGKTDSKVLQVICQSRMTSAQLIANSFRELAENASKIGQLSVSPELLSQLLKER